jgi:hypothetical protein
LEDTAVKKLAVHFCRTKWSTATSIDVEIPSSCQSHKAIKLVRGHTKLLNWDVEIAVQLHRPSSHRHWKFCHWIKTQVLSSLLGYARNIP